jgi:hypothetical protein
MYSYARARAYTREQGTVAASTLGLSLDGPAVATVPDAAPFLPQEGP